MCQMNNKMRQKPSSLYHYTSVEALYKIVDVENGKLSFHLCNPLQSNDRKELAFFRDFLYEGKTGTDIEKRMKSLEKEIGNSYTLSLIHQRRAKEANHKIAMWEMYGNKSKGIKIRLDFNDVKDYCNEQHIKLQLCKYHNSTEIRSIAQNERLTIKKSDFDTYELERVYRDAVFYKDSEWIEENEWRMAVWSSASNVSLRPDGKSYIQIMMPIHCLKSIEIGPKADQAVVKQGLDILAQKIKQRYSIEVKIIKSKLPIR